MMTSAQSHQLWSLLLLGFDMNGECSQSRAYQLQPSSRAAEYQSSAVVRLQIAATLAAHATQPQSHRVTSEPGEL